jgi:hypothetical protein
MGVSPAPVISKRIDKASQVISAVSSGGGKPVEPTWACETVAGVGGFEWREGERCAGLNCPAGTPPSSPLTNGSAPGPLYRTWSLVSRPFSLPLFTGVRGSLILGSSREQLARRTTQGVPLSDGGAVALSKSLPARLRTDRVTTPRPPPAPCRLQAERAQAGSPRPGPRPGRSAMRPSSRRRTGA